MFVESWSDLRFRRTLGRLYFDQADLLKRQGRVEGSLAFIRLGNQKMAWLASKAFQTSLTIDEL